MNQIARLLSSYSFDSDTALTYTSHHLKHTQRDINMASELVVDFPRNHAYVDVRFAKTAHLYIVHEDNNKNELWYTEAEYNSMERNIKQDVLQVRARASDSASEVRRQRLLDWYCSSSHLCSSLGAGDTGTNCKCKFEVWGCCSCLVSRDNEGRNESKEAR